MIDADGHGGEPLGWRRRIPDRYSAQMREYVAQMKAKYKGLPGGGMQINDEQSARARSDPTTTSTSTCRCARGMYDPAARIEDMDLEGIDVTVMFPPGSGEEFALGDVEVLRRGVPHAERRARRVRGATPRAPEARREAPDDGPEAAAAEELERCVTKLRTFVGMVTATHFREKNLDDPSSTWCGRRPSASASRSARTAAVRPRARRRS